MIAFLSTLLMLLLTGSGLDEQTRRDLFRGVRMLEKLQAAMEPRVVLYRVDRIRVYDDAIDFDAEMRVLSRKPLVPCETELLFQVMRFSILDRKECLWQLGKDERNPLIHFVQWKNQNKAFLMPGDETTAEFSFGRGWELRESPHHFSPARVHPGPARVLGHTFMGCHTLDDTGKPVRRHFVTVVFGEPEVTYQVGKTPCKSAVVLRTR